VKLHRRIANSSDIGEERIRRSSSLNPTSSFSGEATEVSPKVWAYFIGTFATEFASKGLQVTLPLLLLQFSKSLSAVGFITALTAGVDMSGTLLGGRLCGRLRVRTLLIAATAARAATLAFIPVLLVTEVLTLPVAAAIFLLDSLARGMADTARNTMPMMLVGKNRHALDRLNSRFQTVFEFGSVVGSFSVGILLVAFGAVAANWLVPVAFGGSALIYALIPRPAQHGISEGWVGSEFTLRSSIRIVGEKPGLSLAFLGMLLLTLYPLKSLLPALFADSVLKAPEQAAWLISIFGLGAVTGSLLYSQLCKKISSSTWLCGSAAGVLLLAVSWIPATFLPMAAGIFLFASSNIMGRLSIVSMLQSLIPQAAEGSVMGVTRFSVNLMSMALRFMVGLAFAVAITPQHGFALVGVGLGIFAALEIWVSRRLKNPQEVRMTIESAPSTFSVLPEIKE
jgi:predicted MFS family arabinose efflux permease